MIFSDPPWNVPIAGNVSGIGKVKRDDFAVACGEMSSTEFENFLQTAHGHASAHSTDGSIHIICMGWSKMRELLAAADNFCSQFKKCVRLAQAKHRDGRILPRAMNWFSSWGGAPHISNIQLGRYDSNWFEHLEPIAPVDQAGH